MTGCDAVDYKGNDRRDDNESLRCLVFFRWAPWTLRTWKIPGGTGRPPTILTIAVYTNVTMSCLCCTLVV